MKDLSLFIFTLVRSYNICFICNFTIVRENLLVPVSLKESNCSKDVLIHLRNDLRILGTEKNKVV
jgi:hypothetical protein